jgi:acyl-CoA dehydrogenase
VSDPLLLEATERAFRDTCTHESVQLAEQEGWATRIWDTAAEMGLPWISVPESAGGAGGSVGDALSVLQVSGRYAAPIPLGETGVLAGWLLAGAGLAVDDRPATVAPPTAADLTLRNGRLSGVARRVPWARGNARMVALVAEGAEPDRNWLVVSVPVAMARVEPDTNMAGEPRDTIWFDGVVPEDVARAGTGADPSALQSRGALVRVALMSGALEQVLALTLTHANVRQQFGRPIAAFQAVQAHLVHLAQHTAMASMAFQLASREADQGDAQVMIAAAKTVLGRAALQGARHAHQVHGAIGMTQEYRLHQFTRRLWSWVGEFGDARTWAAQLGRTLESSGADSLYPAIADNFAALTLLKS